MPRRKTTRTGAARAELARIGEEALGQALGILRHAVQLAHVVLLLCLFHAGDAALQWVLAPGSPSTAVVAEAPPRPAPTPAVESPCVRCRCAAREWRKRVDARADFDV